jgi:hypothetical protein
LNDTGFVIPPKLYDFLKFVSLVILPAVAALVITLGALLHWDSSEVVAGVVTAVDTFMGLVLGKSASNYKQNDPKAVGDLEFGTDDDGNAEVRRIAVNQENPIFKAGTKVYLNVIKQVDQQ